MALASTLPNISDTSVTDQCSLQLIGNRVMIRSDVIVWSTAVRVRRSGMFASRTFVGSGPSVASSSSSSAEACPMLFHWARPPSWESIARETTTVVFLCYKHWYRNRFLSLRSDNRRARSVRRDRRYFPWRLFLLSRKRVRAGVQGTLYGVQDSAVALTRCCYFGPTFYFSNHIRESSSLERSCLI